MLHTIPRLQGTWGRVRPLRHQRRALLVGLAGIVSTLAAAAWLQASELKHSREAFERRALSMQLSMRARFDAPLATLRSVPPFFGASREVEAREFTAFLNVALVHERGIAFIAWAPEISDAERATFERRANELDWPGFAVRDLQRGQGLKPAGQRARYVPLLHIEPKGTPLLGLDLLATPELARAVDLAFRDDELMAASSFDDTGDAPRETLLVLAPLFQVAAVGSDPRAPRRGVAVIALRLATLLQSSVTRASFVGLDLVLYDRGSGTPERLLFESSPGAALLAQQQADVVLEQSAPYSGRNWVWRFHAHPGTIAAGSGPTILVLFGVVLSLVAMFAVGSLEVVRRLRLEVTVATQLGQYRLVRKLGEGGMGVVYQAEHALLRRPTAVKLIAKGLGDADLIARFEREVKATSQLSHPNTIAVYDFGCTPDGIFYYAMEYLHGVSVDALVHAVGPLPPARVVHLLKQVCGSLGEAHAQGFVHRDVKPGNLIICERGGIADFVKVLDFGLVKDVTSRENTHSSQAGHLFGTPQYMAPESFRGSVAASPLVDIYAVGAVAYFMLTGRDAFAAESLMELIALQLEGQVVAPAAVLGRALPADLERIVMRCLSNDSAQRPRSAQELSALLDECALPPWTQADAQAFWTEHRALLQSSRPHSGDTAWSATLAVDLAMRQAPAERSL